MNSIYVDKNLSLDYAILELVFNLLCEKERKKKELSCIEYVNAKIVHILPSAKKAFKTQNSIMSSFSCKNNLLNATKCKDL